MILFVSMLLWAQEPETLQPEQASTAPVVPSKSQALYATAKRLFEQSAYEDAVDTYLLLMQNNPPIIAYKELALSYQFLGKYEDAITFMSYYKEQAPDAEKPKIDKIILHLRDMMGKTTAKIQGNSILENKERDTHTNISKIQKNVAIGFMLTGGVVGGLFQYQAYQSRIEINASCIRMETRLVCPDSIQQVRTQEKDQILYSSIGWGVGALGFLTNTFLTLKHGNTISFTSNSIFLQGAF